MHIRRIALLVTAILSAGCFGEPGTAPGETTGMLGSNNGTSTNGNNETAGETTQPCVPVEEACDGVDNDCDGEVDEGFDLGDACDVGVGACAAGGAMVCSSDGTGAVCDAVEGTPETERCDEIDNDCDGEVDEDFELGVACTTGLGVCTVEGLTVCTADGLAVECAGDVPEPPETEETMCDRLDNDCDGVADEGCDDDGDGFCDTALTLVLPDGLLTCEAGDCDDTDDTIYPGSPAGRCDGKDNDCSGEVDELRRSATHPRVTNNQQLATAFENSPIQVVPSSSGFCFFATGGVSNARTTTFGEYVTATGVQTVEVEQRGGERRVADVEWSGATCAGIEIVEDGDTSLDVDITRWSGALSARRAQVVNDGIFHITGSWDAALVYSGGRWGIGYSTTSGSTADYVTVSEVFGTLESPSVPLGVGLNGQFPEFGIHPGSSYQLLFASNFGAINFHQLDFGTDASPVGNPLRISGSTSHRNLVINTVNGETWFAAFTGTDWLVRRISATPSYDLMGQIFAGNYTGQEFLTRNAFVSGPLGQLLFIDAVRDRLNTVADDGAGGLVTKEVVDPVAGANQHLLAARQASADTIEAFWLVKSSGGQFEYEIAEYTCF